MSQKYHTGEFVQFIDRDSNERLSGEIVGQNGEFGKIRPFLYRIKDTMTDKEYNVGEGYIITEPLDKKQNAEDINNRASTSGS